MRLDELAQALRIAQYTRIAIQVHDSHLARAPDIVEQLQADLGDSNVSLLGDSVTQCCLDEVSAEHYGSDCIVKLGHTCWFASQRMVAYFLPVNQLDPCLVCENFETVRRENPKGTVVLFVDSTADAAKIVGLPASDRGEVVIAVSACMSYPGSEKGALSWFGRVPFCSVGIGAVAKRVEPMARIAGRLLFRMREDGQFVQLGLQAEADALVGDPATTFVVASSECESLYHRLVNRFGFRKGRVVMTGEGASSLTNYSELLRRYRGVESVKFARSVGIVVTNCSASRELFKVRDLLSEFLRSLNKEVHMFSVGKVEGVKLGNFPEIDCFVILACPESEYFESADLHATCVSGFEALVAVEALDWTDHVITDYDEMLVRMHSELPPRTPRTPRARNKVQLAPPSRQPRLAPAKIEMGLRGIPSRYTSEPAGHSSSG